MSSFIGEYLIDDLSFCDKLIEYFKISDKKQPGTVISGVNSDIKDSTDILLQDDIQQEYFTHIRSCTDAYIKDFPACNMYAPWGVFEKTRLQYYKPMSGFKVWHTERAGTEFPSHNRHLVYMTYLNDVTDGGGTEFMNQKLVVDAVKGKTLIWPADWTHTHRGVISSTQEKYIVTGWFSFL
jgi:hypothetical protein